MQHSDVTMDLVTMHQYWLFAVTDVNTQEGLEDLGTNYLRDVHSNSLSLSASHSSFCAVCLVGWLVFGLSLFAGLLACEIL